ncbi:FAD/NAD-binding domain-containing protein [Calocera viscosa TUFC12733]|uniref:FAD/NAD-binding domain-containing protein n=1 Tax=Calocera viscosa (strain TUFC12733) TaxID=1330018 RepID=A0A167J277_CALVF|nr:FAD/NAD-binding domain-containing protein [Calocera viscosa TUFC12733]
MAAPAPDLPTHTTLGGPPPSNVTPASAPALASSWFDSFTTALSTHDLPALLALFYKDSYWRDMLALTWDFRTFHGSAAIQTFLEDRLQPAELSGLQLVLSGTPPTLEQPWEDVSWLVLHFTFSTKVGTGSGIVRLVYEHPAGSPGTGEGGSGWKAYTVYTNLESLHGAPESTGALRDPLPNHGQWLSSLARTLDFEHKDPEVLIIGAGQSGLDVAVRLKVLGVSVLCVERNGRVGDQWRGRYEALCLHDPVWYDHLPYLPFPPTWPVYTPAHKLADWLANYAHTMELPIWLSSTIQSATWDEQAKLWDVVVRRGVAGEERRLRVRHVVYAAGLAGGVPNMPKIAGMEDFQGQIVHSTAHKTAAAYVGQRVLVVGAATSAHDIAHDFANHGVEVTLFQRASTYIMSTKHGMPVVMRGLYWEDGPATDVADRLSASLPNEVMRRVHRRYTREIGGRDRELLEGLDRVGFRRNDGVEGSGFLFLAYSRGGGYYLDVGASQLIIDGKIGLKNGCEIDRFTKDGVRFDDGSEIKADLVVFATGFGNIKSSLEPIFQPEVVDALKPVWGVDGEGEIRAAWGESGHEAFWYMMGNLCLCRFHSKHIALQIKAMQMGVFGERYTRGKPS